MRKFLLQGFPIFLVASLTLGLAPFSPEPHIWEKIRWLASGYYFPEWIYWGDFFLHGTPWILLIASSIVKLQNFRQHKG